MKYLVTLPIAKKDQAFYSKKTPLMITLGVRSSVRRELTMESNTKRFTFWGGPKAVLAKGGKILLA